MADCSRRCLSAIPKRPDHWLRFEAYSMKLPLEPFSWSARTGSKDSDRRAAVVDSVPLGLDS